MSNQVESNSQDSFINGFEGLKISESLELGVVLLNSEERVVIWNNWMEIRSGVEATKAIGQKFNDIFPEANEGRYLTSIRQALTVGLSSVISHTLNKYPLPLYHNFINQNQAKNSLSQMIQIKPTFIGTEKCCLVQIFDVSSSVSRDLMLREQAKNLKIASDLKSEFISNASHEIRTPLNSIIGFTERLLNYDVSRERQIDALEIIHKNGRHLLQLVNDLLDISKIQAGQTELRLIDLDFVELIKAQTLAFSPLIGDKDLKIVSELPEGKVRIKADYQRIEQILNNLISNAIKYTNEGVVEIRLQDLGEEIQFHVKDTGIGIPKDKIPLLFSRFGSIQGGKSISESAGLGLAITYKLVELHGGRLDVESVENQGSCFTVTFPRAAYDTLGSVDKQTA